MIKKLIEISDLIIENRLLRHRIGKLEDEILYVVTQQGNDLCWLDVYRRLAGLVGVKFDPTVLDEGTMFRECQTFVRSLKEGDEHSYKMGGYTGQCTVVHALQLSCGHCDKCWEMPSADPSGNFFCPYCGKQQSFQASPGV